MKNKIKIDMEKILLSEDINLLRIDKPCDYKIIINKNVDKTLEIISTCDYSLNITLEEGSKLTINSLNKNNNVQATISLKEKASLLYNHSVVSFSDSENSFTINHLGDDSISVLNNNGINLGNDKLFFVIDGVIPKGLKNINCNQSSKIINYRNGNSKIIPSLIIDSQDIIANHASYIGYINKEEKFYLQSRGISEKEIKKLIYRATLLGKMQLSSEEEFNQIINEWW